VLTLVVVLAAAYAISRILSRRNAQGQLLIVTQMLSALLLVPGKFRMGASIHIGGLTLVDARSTVAVIYVAYQLAFAIWMLASYISPLSRLSWSRRSGSFGGRADAWRTQVGRDWPGTSVPLSRRIGDEV